MAAIGPLLGLREHQEAPVAQAHHRLGALVARPVRHRLGRDMAIGLRKTLGVAPDLVARLESRPDMAGGGIEGGRFGIAIDLARAVAGAVGQLAHRIVPDRPGATIEAEARDHAAVAQHHEMPILQRHRRNATEAPVGALEHPATEITQLADLDSPGIARIERNRRGGHTLRGGAEGERQGGERHQRREEGQTMHRPLLATPRRRGSLHHSERGLTAMFSSSSPKWCQKGANDRTSVSRSGVDRMGPRRQ